MSRTYLNDMLKVKRVGDTNFYQVMVYKGPFTQGIKNILKRYKDRETPLMVEYGFQVGPETTVKRSWTISPRHVCGSLYSLSIADVDGDEVTVEAEFKPLGMGAGEVIQQALDSVNVGGELGFKARHPLSEEPITEGEQPTILGDLVITFDVVSFQPVDYTPLGGDTPLPMGKHLKLADRPGLRLLSQEENLYTENAAVVALHRDSQGLVRRLPLKVIVPEGPGPHGTINLLMEELPEE